MIPDRMAVTESRTVSMPRLFVRPRTTDSQVGLCADDLILRLLATARVRRCTAALRISIRSVSAEIVLRPDTEAIMLPEENRTVLCRLPRFAGDLQDQPYDLLGK